MVSAQLPLFDMAAVIKPTYKIGDLVKLRKKPSAASYVKKGDIVEIAAVHPIDASIKFWNERSERWEFVYPDEVARVFDSVTPAEVAVTESNYPHSETDSNPALEAVTELIFPPGKNDSVTPVESVVTKSTLPPSNNDSVTLNAISTYRPRGTARGGEYYRLSYRDGCRVRHVHIRGGNTDSPIAQAKVAEVRSLLAAGVPPIQVAELLKVSKTKNN